MQTLRQVRTRGTGRDWQGPAGTVSGKLIFKPFLSSSNGPSHGHYYDGSESEEYDNYPVEEDSFTYDNITHLADYLETANAANRKLNNFLSLPALLFVFL